MPSSDDILAVIVHGGLTQGVALSIYGHGEWKFDDDGNVVERGAVIIDHRTREVRVYVGGEVVTVTTCR